MLTKKKKKSTLKGWVWWRKLVGGRGRRSSVNSRTARTIGRDLVSNKEKKNQLLSRNKIIKRFKLIVCATFTQ